ncbi:unnamed protein product, partial [Ilex paraguariensis]
VQGTLAESVIAENNREKDNMETCSMAQIQLKVLSSSGGNCVERGAASVEKDVEDMENGNQNHEVQREDALSSTSIPVLDASGGDMLLNELEVDREKENENSVDVEAENSVGSGNGVLVGMVLGKVKVPWKYKQFIDDICGILHRFNIKVSHIFREANGLADFLASYAVNEACCFEFLGTDSLPIAGKMRLHHDQLSLSTLRRKMILVDSTCRQLDTVDVRLNGRQEQLPLLVGLVLGSFCFGLVHVAGGLLRPAGFGLFTCTVHVHSLFNAAAGPHSSVIFYLQLGFDGLLPGFSARQKQADQRFSMTPYIKPSVTPTGTPKIISTSVSPRRYSAAGSPQKSSATTSPRKNQYEGRGTLSSWYPSSSVVISRKLSSNWTPNARFGKPIAISNSTSGSCTPRIDGKEFFRQARSRLSYEQFSAFLANINELNAQKQSREETLHKAEDIFGMDNKKLYSSFKGLLNRNIN